VNPRPGRIFPRFSPGEDVERELEAHVAMRAEELVAEGWAPEAAEQEARRLLGDRETLAGECVEIVNSHQRAVRRATIVDELIQDLRYGLRTVLASPGFAIVAVITLALGIGANTTIFSVVHGVLLEPLPYDEPEELVWVRELRNQGGTMSPAYANFRDWHGESSSFSEIFVYTQGSTTVLGGDQPVTATVTNTSVDVWSALGAVPLHGRLTTDADHVQGTAPVVVVSEGFWRNELAARPLTELVLDLSGFSASVVGVVPSSFDFPAGTQIWLPMELLAPSESRTSHGYSVVGRLADGVSLPRATEEMHALTLRLVEREPDGDPDYLAAGAALIPLQEQLVGDARTPLLILLGAAGLVLLVACTNLASTLLARGSVRARELAVRASLGAGRSRIVRQLLTESGVLAGVGALMGVALAAGLLELLQRMGPDAVPRLDEVGLDGTVLGYTALITIGTVLLFGLFPALRLAKGDASDVLRAGSRGNAVGSRGAAWTVLVGSEVALALILLVGSGLLVRSFQTLLAEDAGFDASDVISTPIDLSLIAYPDPREHVAFHDRLLAELESTPGVAAAGLMSSLPLTGFLPNGRVELDGDLDNHAEAGGYVTVSPGAFEALDIPLLQGRNFDERDVAGQPHVVIVSESFAREYWPGESPLGHTVTGGGLDSFWQQRPFAEVIGVVGDVRYRGMGEEPVPTLYFPYTQRPSRIVYGGTLVVEASNGNPSSVGPVVRETLQRLDSNIPIELTTQQQVIGESVAAREFSMLLLAGFSILALVLAVVGIYGVVSYSVAQRTREMGIRLALGAEPGGVVGLVMRGSMGMVLVGLVVGVVGALLTGRVMQEMLYEIEPTDPLAILAGVLILAGAAVLASWVPARLGTRVDPMVTMRAE
jgi:putative ABC transport system permease protein